MKSSLVLSAAGRRYGYRTGAASYPLAQATIPLARRVAAPADLEPLCGPVKDQGQLGACTAFAGTGDLEYLFRRYRNADPVFSPLFLYYQERLKDGDLADGDTGSTGNTSCWALNHVGCCLEADDGYDPSKLQTPPTDLQTSAAALYRTGAYHAVMTLADIRSCLSSGYAVRMGFTVYESFESEQTANTGIMPLPDKAKEQVLGGHEVLVIGFDDGAQQLKVRNSWGAGWGQGGNFKFPYAAVGDPDLFLNGRIQHFGSPWVPK